jgi:hypothetical protein
MSRGERAAIFICPRDAHARWLSYSAALLAMVLSMHSTLAMLLFIYFSDAFFWSQP